MTYVALTALAISLISTSVFAGLIRSLVRQQARERGLLLNQIMHLAGRTWQQPPIAEPVADEEPVLVYAAEQDPDY